MKPFQQKLCLTVLQAMLSLLIIAAFFPTAAIGNCNESRWVRVPNWDYLIPAYPEQSATYWVFDFYTDENMELRIEGEFPKARYMSFILYDFNAGEFARFKGATQIIEDRDITPDEGSENPYLNGVTRSPAQRHYTIHVVNENSDRIDEDEGPNENTLVIPDGIQVASVFIRVYHPDNPESKTGDVDLPDIIPVDRRSDEPIACPVQQLRYPDILTSGERPAPPDVMNMDDSELIPEDIIYAFNPGPGWGLFPNGDNPYLIVPLLPKKLQVATVKFKAPTFLKTRSGGQDGRFSKKDDVRYFSVCMGGIQRTNTSECIADEDLKIDEDNMVRIAVAPGGIAGSFANDPKWNMFKWGLHASPVLVFRQIAPNSNFEKSFNFVEEAFNADQSGSGELTVAGILDKRASKYIQEYAPEGVFCNRRQFIENRCGM